MEVEKLKAKARMAVEMRPSSRFMLVAITPEEIFDKEAEALVMLLEEGIDRVHIRHPRESADKIGELLMEIPESYHARISLHQHHALAERFQGTGVHLNRKNPVIPHGISGSVSCSCHTLTEIQALEDNVKYAFLSPVFNSISKEGYMAAVDMNETLHETIRSRTVVGLSGVTPQTFAMLEKAGFSGAAMLGWLWK